MKAANSETSGFLHLDSLDGFEFEKLCGQIFDRLGYGRVEDVPYVGDEGRDLIIHTSEGTKIVVECKHHPNGTIGRPVVQKLHSAVVTEGATKGILVTTGKFSDEAIFHARKVRPQIDLVDLNLLRDLAERAGIHVLAGGEKPPLSYFPASESSEVTNTLLSSVSNRIVTRPSPPGEVLQLYGSRLKLRPAYYVSYSVHHDFRTSVGIIHSVHVDNGELLLDGESGLLIERILSNFLAGTPTVTGDKVAHLVSEVERGAFQIDQTTLTDRAKQTIADRHSTVVSYYGRNNIRYRAECRPGDRSIFIRNVRQVFFPVWSLSFLALSKQYSVTLVEKPGAVQILQSNLYTCKICGRDIAGQFSVCNACGNVTHVGQSHGFGCKVCAKSLCRNCTYWVRKWLFFKDFLCENCAVQRQKLGKKIKELVQEMPRKYCTQCGAKIHADAVRCAKCWSMQ